MSIRHYTPRRRRYGQLSPRVNGLLNSVVAIAILLQVIYPLVDGEVLRLLTLNVIYWGAGAMLLHALLAYGTPIASHNHCGLLASSTTSSATHCWPSGTHVPTITGRTLQLQLPMCPLLAPRHNHFCQQCHILATMPSWMPATASTPTLAPMLHSPPNMPSLLHSLANKMSHAN